MQRIKRKCILHSALGIRGQLLVFFLLIHARVSIGDERCEGERNGRNQEVLDAIIKHVFHDAAAPREVVNVGARRLNPNSHKS